MVRRLMISFEIKTCSSFPYLNCSNNRKRSRSFVHFAIKQKAENVFVRVSFANLNKYVMIFFRLFSYMAQLRGESVVYFYVYFLRFKFALRKHNVQFTDVVKMILFLFCSEKNGAILTSERQRAMIPVKDERAQLMS